MAVIKLTLGEEVQPKIEERDDFATSIFQDVYAKSFNLLADMHSAAIKYDKQDNKRKYYKEELNNIIAFVGERGSGKTSCMLSFMECLQTDLEGFKFKNADIDKIANVGFHLSDIIDPSFFDQKHNILDIILGKLFKNFKEHAELYTNNINEDYSKKKRDLIGAFQKAKDQVDAMTGDNVKSNDSLDCLLKLSSGAELKDTIRELVDAYLDYFQLKGKNKKKYLVIPIDDIDLHTENAYKMVEQIRKYFIQPNIIILMAVKLDQLQDVIMKHYHSEFKDVKDKIFDSVDLMAERYVTKLIPYEHRLYLPEITDLYTNQLIVVGVDKQEMEYQSVRESVLSIIFIKTRYLFFNSEEKNSHILPTNLRSLMELLAMFHNMKSANKSKEVSERYNQFLFKKYFIETWCKSNLTNEQYQFIKELMIKDAESKNKFTLLYFYGLYSDLLSEDDNKTFSIIENIASYNVSLGEALYLLNQINIKCTDENMKRFIFSVKSLYSIFLYDYYKTQEIRVNNSELLINENKFLYNKYLKFVGGQYITPYNAINPNGQKNIIQNFYRNDITNDSLSKINLDNLLRIEIQILLCFSNNESSGLDYNKCHYDYNIYNAIKSDSIMYCPSELFFNILKIKVILTSVDSNFFKKALKLKKEDILQNEMISILGEKRRSSFTLPDLQLLNTSNLIFLQLLLIQSIRLKGLFYKLFYSLEEEYIGSQLTIKNIEVLENMFVSPQIYKDLNCSELYEELFSYASYKSKLYDGEYINYKFVFVILEHMSKIKKNKS